MTETALFPGIAITFAAGLVGFLSPCVLPLLPGFVGFMTGSSVGVKVPARRAVPGTLAFVGGLTVVFVALGASASVLAGFLNDYRATLQIASGAFIVAMGALMLAIDRIPLLTRERRFHLKPGGGPARTFLLGGAFAFAWTPCIGPTLGAALNLAATSEGLGSGVVLLLFYSLGLGLPFVLAGLGLVSFGGRLKRHARTIQIVGGLILIAVGVLILLPYTGLTDVGLTSITIWMQRALTSVGLDIWNF